MSEFRKELIENLKETVSKNLPELAANELKDFIENAQKAAEDLERAQDRLKERNTKVIELDNKICTLNEKISKYKDIEDREAILRESEAEHRVSLLLFQQEKQLLQANADNLNSMVGIVFKSPDAKKLSFNLFGNGMIPVKDNNGYSNLESINMSLNGDVKEENK